MATPHREARPVTVQLHAQPLTLPPPYRPQDQQLTAVTVWVVLAQEVHTPAGAEPVEWLLLTSLPVPDFAAAVQILEWYACRWEVGIYFRVFKQGCRVERSQMDRDKRLWPALALYQMITWRILYLTMLGRLTLPPLRVIVALIARLGGFKGRKSDGEPDPKVMWEGLVRLYDLAWA